MSRKTPYPSAHEIEDIFQLRESVDTQDQFTEYLAKNIEATVMGDDHHLSATHKGVDALVEGNKDRLVGMQDRSKPFTLDIINVIGGGESPWACVEMKTHGRAKSGKKWNHEFVYVVRFNNEGKISKMRIYLDSAHVSSHVEEHKKVST